LLVDDVKQMDVNTLSDLLSDLLKSANGLADMLKNLLKWAKLQTGREIYHPLPFDLFDAIQPDLEVIKSMAERKDIDFKVAAPPSAIITGDENMLVTVVRNLLTNAVKFTGAGGNVSLRITGCNGKYIVAVSDTGVGMAQEQLQNLFRIDRQHLRKGTAGEQSSGLGLIVCKEMLEKHGSRLNVESEEGKGSKFWFEVHIYSH
jgi:signal transduction histidine kinase